MKNTLNTTIFAIMIASVNYSSANARDWWNGAGYSLDHSYHTEFEPNDHTLQAPIKGTIRQIKPSTTTSEMAKLRAQRLVCNPVIIYMDEGVFAHRASGCLR